MEKVQEKLVGRRELEGVVVSDKMNKTVVVKVPRVFRHPVLGKTVRRAKNYFVHDEKRLAKLGDQVVITECRPLSKLKHMVLVGVSKSAPKNA